MISQTTYRCVERVHVAEGVVLYCVVYWHARVVIVDLHELRIMRRIRRLLVVKVLKRSAEAAGVLIKSSVSSEDLLKTVVCNVIKYLRGDRLPTSTVPCAVVSHPVHASVVERDIKIVIDEDVIVDTSNCKTIGHLSTQNHHFSGAILHYLTISLHFQLKISKEVGI